MNGVKEIKGAVHSPGARVKPHGVSYRVWAPDQSEMRVVVERAGATWDLVLQPQPEGFWSAFDPRSRAGDRYRFRRGDGRLLPDVASRFQPEGVDGPSECIDPWNYCWQSNSWISPSWAGQSIYEIHVGTLTAAGTFLAAIATLDRVRDLGAEAIEIMPIADFAGERNWGYDGVALYAPARCYGRPDDLRALVDAAHQRGLAVILDVVYNHVGPSGNYLAEYCADYFHPEKSTAWGPAFNLDGPRSQSVREFLINNAAYWLDEFRFDGLRLDATHAIHDDSSPHLLAEIADAVQARGGFLIAEDERNEAAILSPGGVEGIQFDAAWADDFHHQVRVALTGTRQSYFRGYRGQTADIASTLTHGWTYRGEPYAPWGGRARGTACDHLPARTFVVCIENHDQIGNRPNGERLEHLVTARQFRAGSLLLCLSPYAPLIFMGQEWAATSPFLYFTDHRGELGRRISTERKREFEKDNEAEWATGAFPDPESSITFGNSKLNWDERELPEHAAILTLYREALRQRRTVLTGAVLQRERWDIQHADEFVGVRYHGESGARLLVVALTPGSFQLPEALRPDPGYAWRTVLDSEERRFGGEAEYPAAADGKVMGPVALWLEAVPEEARHAAH